MKGVSIFCGVVLLTFVSACGPSMRIKPGEIPVATLPPQNLKIEAESYVSQHISEENYKEIKSGADLKRTRNVVERLSQAAGYPPKTFPVHLVDAGSEVNAAAFNGASIVVYQELLRKVTSDDELATVLGHEVGHIIAKHYTEDKEQEARSEAVSIGSTLLGLAASVATSAAGYRGASDLAGDVAETATGAIGYGAFVGSFSRRQEYEADHLGLMIMAKAGYDPRIAIDFWKRSKEVFGATSSEVGAFFSTHPAATDRVDELEVALPQAISYYEQTATPPNIPTTGKRS